MRDDLSIRRRRLFHCKKWILSQCQQFSLSCGKLTRQGGERRKRGKLSAIKRRCPVGSTSPGRRLLQTSRTKEKEAFYRDVAYMRHLLWPTGFASLWLLEIRKCMFPSFGALNTVRRAFMRADIDLCGTDKLTTIEKVIKPPPSDISPFSHSPSRVSVVSCRVTQGYLLPMKLDKRNQCFCPSKA